MTKNINDIPDIPLEQFEPIVEDVKEIENTVIGSLNFAFIGVGQCGSRLAHSFFSLGYKKAIAINTASQDLESIEMPKNQKLLVRKAGFEEGVAKNMDLATSIMLENQQTIMDLMSKVFGNKVDHIMICASSGGGTGAGGAMPLLSMCRKYLEYLGFSDADSRVGVLMALPTRGEAKHVAASRNTIKVVNDVYNSGACPFVIIDNDKIESMYRNIPPKQFYPMVNSSVAMLFDVFNRLSMVHTEYVSFDPASYKAVIKSKGCMILGLAGIKKVEDLTDISAAIKDNMFKTLLAEGFDLASAKSGGCIIVGNKKQMNESTTLKPAIDYSMDMLSNICKNIFRGIYESDKEGLKAYTILGGLALPTDRLNKIMLNLSRDWAKDGTK